LQLYHNLFGDYPFIKEKYGHVQFGWGGGMEHQTATFVVNAGEGLMAHELGHQWFGDKITCASWEDIWLNEGFATHLASIYMETKYPASTITTRKNEIASITSQPGGSVKVNDTTNVGRIFDGRLSYTKGSHLLYMLRWILSDSVFFNTIRQYAKDPKVSYGFATNNDLKRNLEQVSGKDLTKFFKDWYEGQGYPSYIVEWTPLGSSYVKIKMNQTTSHSSVSFFELPVALNFKNATQQKTIVLDNTSNGEIFFRNIGFIPDTVLIDPEYWLITRNNTSRKVPDAVNGQNIVQVFPNPIQNQFYVYLRNFSSSNASIILYNAAGQQIHSAKISISNGSGFTEITPQYLAPGEYIITVVTDNGQKFVKKLLK
jgi:aminopeptidase N